MDQNHCTDLIVTLVYAMIFLEIFFFNIVKNILAMLSLDDGVKINIKTK